MIRAATIAALAFLAALPAQAQRTPCGDGGSIIAHLEKEWGEDPEILALDATGRMVRILVNPETGTWSMLVTHPGGLTCLVASGVAWHKPHRPTEPGDPS